MKHLTQTLCGALMILPTMLWAQEELDKTKDQEVVVEWITNGELPEGMDEKIQAIIDEELKHISKDANGIKMMVIDDADIEIDANGETHSKTVKIISEKDENGNVVLTKFLNGKEVPIEEGEDVFIMDSRFSELKFPKEIEEIHELKEMLEENELDSKEIEEKLREMKVKLDTQNEFFQDVNIIKEIDENGIEQTRVFMNGEEVDSEDFPVMDFKLSDTKQFPDGDVKVIMICEQIMIDHITDEDKAPKNLKISKEPLELEELSMFPNPNNGIFTLKLQGESDAKVNVRILNVEGKTIYNEKLKPSGGLCTQEIDISGEGKGMYFLNIEQKGKYLSRKIVVQ